MHITLLLLIFMYVKYILITGKVSAALPDCTMERKGMYIANINNIYIEYILNVYINQSIHPYLLLIVFLFFKSVCIMNMNYYFHQISSQNTAMP